mgnify:CR=1 FL=1
MTSKTTEYYETELRLWKRRAEIAESRFASGRRNELIERLEDHARYQDVLAAHQWADDLRSAVAAIKERDALRRALQFYADKDHMLLGEPDAWGTVSGEPQNFWCDDAGTATIEDGWVAREVLAGRDPFEGEHDAN